jgi:hypothetical protein
MGVSGKFTRENEILHRKLVFSQRKIHKNDILPHFTLLKTPISIKNASKALKALKKS